MYMSKSTKKLAEDSAYTSTLPALFSYFFKSLRHFKYSLLNSNSKLYQHTTSSNIGKKIIFQKLISVKLRTQKTLICSNNYYKVSIRLRETSISKIF